MPQGTLASKPFCEPLVPVSRPAVPSARYA